MTDKEWRNHPANMDTPVWVAVVVFIVVIGLPLLIIFGK
jgi:hypothetical protein